MTKTLVLDIGGVLYLGSPDTAYWARWGQRLGVSAEHLQRGLWFGPDIEACNIGRLGAEAYYERTAARLGIGEPASAAMIDEAFRGEINHTLLEWVRAFRVRGGRAVALTNNWASETALSSRAELAGLFEAIVSSADVGCTKPGDRIFQIAAARFGEEPSDLVFVDDTLVHVQTAVARGWRGIHFRNTADVIASLEGEFV